MQIKGITATISTKKLSECINENLSNEQKVQLAKQMAEFGKLIDMGYTEALLVMAAKLRLKAIRKDRALYNRNRPYFKALKTIAKIKTAE